MTYAQLRKTVQAMPVFRVQDIAPASHSGQALLNQVSRWQKKGLIIQLKRGLYMLNEHDRALTPSLSFLANRLYEPSYISLEYALGFYGLIPEQAAAVTSTTTLKTARFENISGAFIYQHIKPEAFRGFRSARDSAGLAYFIAEPEKAVVDFLYLRSRSIPDASTAVFAESFRFQNTGVLSARKILEFSRLFDSRRLAELANGFCGFLKEARHR